MWSGPIQQRSVPRAAVREEVDELTLRRGAIGTLGTTDVGDERCGPSLVDEDRACSLSSHFLQERRGSGMGDVALQVRGVCPRSSAAAHQAAPWGAAASVRIARSCARTPRFHWVSQNRLLDGRVTKFPYVHCTGRRCCRDGWPLFLRVYGVWVVLV